MVQIERQQPAPIRGLYGSKRLAIVLASVVDQHADAIVHGFHILYGYPQCIDIQQVAGYESRACPLSECTAGLSIHVQECNSCALLRERLHHGLTNAVRSAGDQDRAAFE